MPDPVVYSSDVDDNTRWWGFPFRDGDVVVSTRSKHGTTWVQRILGALVFGGPELPAPLAELSPWVDWRGEPLAVVLERLAAQRHRRVLKSHTPLDGLPMDRRAAYVVVARHPLDGAVSLYHQGANMDRARVAELLGDPAPDPEELAARERDRLPVGAWLREWVADPATARESLESPAGVLHHVADAWARREAHRADAAAPQVVLVHYTDLAADLAGGMRALAAELGFAVDEDAWPALVDAARFESMRAAAPSTAPDLGRVLRSRDAFFRGGRVGDGAALLTQEEVAAFEARCRELAPAPVVDWLLR